MKSGIASATFSGALLALFAGSAHAQSDYNESGFYLGGGFGAYDVQVDDIDDTDEALQRIDDDDNAWRIFGGWRFNRYVGAELAYVDFGGPSDEFEAGGSSGNYSLDFSGFHPGVYGAVPLGPVELFAKLGYYFYDVDLNVDFDDPLGDDEIFDSDTSEEAWSYSAGVGVTFLQHVHARLEYEKIDTDTVDDLDSVWLTAAWRF